MLKDHIAVKDEKLTDSAAKSRQNRVVELQDAIDGITLQLKGPLPYFERQLLAEDRKDFREELRRLESTEADL